MALSLAEKKEVVAQVSELAQGACSALVAEYRGMSVADMTALRQKARESSVKLRVVKNTLTRLALKDTEFSCLDKALVGPLCIAFSTQAPSDAARLVKDFAKENSKINVKAIALGGKLLDASQLAAVASLPTRDEAISKLMYVLKAPVEKFVRTMAEPHAKLVRTFAAVGEKKRADSN